MTNFPGIEIIRIDTKGSVIADDEGPSIDVGSETITSDFINEKLGGEQKLHYSLSVKALTERGAKAKAKAFVRFKNPFEVTMVQVTSIEKVDEDDPLDTYSIGVGIAKA